jgi:glycerol-3-phosphate O-acyltransferase
MLERRLVVAAAIAAVTLGSAALGAHHSYSATYESREITLEGRLMQFVYRNPHSFVHVQAKDEKGVEQRWAVEWSGTAQLDRSGVTRETLKVGDAVVIVGRPSRVAGEYRALMVTLKRPSDGFTWGVRAGETVD